VSLWFRKRLGLVFVLNVVGRWGGMRSVCVMIVRLQKIWSTRIIIKLVGDEKMCEKVLKIWQVLDPADWLKLYTNEYYEPVGYERLNGCYIYQCFACHGDHLYFCFSEEKLDLQIPRITMEALNQFERVFWDETSYSEWYLEMLALTASNYKEK